MVSINNKAYVNGYFFTITIVFLYISCSFFSTPVMAQVKGCPFTKLYYFGDADSSTSNGLLLSNYLASAFHLPSPKEYYPKTKDAKFDYGASFGKSGTTAMNLNFFKDNGIQVPSTISSLDEQYFFFKSLVNHNCYSHNGGCKTRFRRSIAVLDEIGNNDYKYAIMHGKSFNDILSDYMPQVVLSIKNTIKKLIFGGIGSVLVTGVLPIGCFPGYLTQFYVNNSRDYDSIGCLRDLNFLAKVHNTQIEQELHNLRKEYHFANIIYADNYEAFISLVLDHEKLGFHKNFLLKACCGAYGFYDFEEKNICGSDQSVPAVCVEPSKYLNWDGFHLTEKANKLIVETIINKMGFLRPEKLQFPHIMHCVM